MTIHVSLELGFVHILLITDLASVFWLRCIGIVLKGMGSEVVAARKRFPTNGTQQVWLLITMHVFYVALKIGWVDGLELAFIADQLGPRFVRHVFNRFFQYLKFHVDRSEKKTSLRKDILPKSWNVGHFKVSPCSFSNLRPPPNPHMVKLRLLPLGC